MDFEEVINARRSIRKFKIKKVSDELINKLLEAARVSPSAKNRQPWKIMILRENEKNDIANIMLGLFEKNNVDLPGYGNSSKSSANIIKNSDVLMLIFREKDDDWLVGDLVSIGAAIEHICLEAVNLGLGSLWIRDTIYTENEICHHVGCDDLELISAVAIGYADESPKQRPRKAIDEILINKNK